MAQNSVVVMNDVGVPVPVSLVAAEGTGAAGSSEVVIGATGGITNFASDTFTRPANTDAYAAGDAVSATVSDTGTTPLRSLANLVRLLGGSGYLTGFRLWTDQAANVAAYRIHFYKVSAPAGAVVGDNVAMTLLYANFAQRIGHVDLPAMKTSTVAGTSTAAATSDLTTRMPFKVDAAQDDIYYRLETLTAFNPASAQSFSLEVAAESNS